MSFDFLSPNSIDPKSFKSIDPNVEGVTLSQYPLSISVWFKSVNAGIALIPSLVCLTVAGNERIGGRPRLTCDGLDDIGFLFVE